MPKYKITNSTKSNVLLPGPLAGTVAPYKSISIVAPTHHLDTPAMKQMTAKGLLTVTSMEDSNQDPSAASISRWEVTEIVRESSQNDKYTRMWHWLRFDSPDPWTSSQVSDGLLTTLFSSPSALPALPPDPNSPSFAIIADGDNLPQLAYWNHGTGALGSWAVTSAPWTYPFLAEGPVLALLPGNGAGSSPWNYTMGSEFQIVADGNITEMYIKQGGVPSAGNRWEIRKSTVTGSSPPPTSSYTNTLATGVVNLSAPNAWTSVSLPSPISVSAGEWVVSIHHVSSLGGQNANIVSLRSGGQLTEDFAVLNAGVYAAGGGPAPGVSPLPTPTVRQATIIYGINTLEFGS